MLDLFAGEAVRATRAQLRYSASSLGGGHASKTVSVPDGLLSKDFHPNAYAFGFRTKGHGFGVLVFGYTYFGWFGYGTSESDRSSCICQVPGRRKMVRLTHV